MSGETYRLADLREQLADRFDLSEAERREMLPSGRVRLFANRVAWSAVYLTKAGLLQRVRRGHYRITETGREVVSEGPERVDVKYLDRFPEFSEFRKRPKKQKKEEPGDPEPTETPEETIERAHAQLREALAGELLDQVRSGSPEFFERLVVDLLVSMGYGGSRRDAGMAVGKGGDEGIDGIIKEDRLGLDVVYIQAKRWEGTVGRPEIQKFVGALHGKHARKGVFITTGAFSAGAVDYAAGIDSRIVLIDGPRLAELMIDYGLGVSTKQSYEVKTVDTDFFEEGE